MKFNQRFQNINLPECLLICVTFYFNRNRLSLLKEISKHFSSLGKSVRVFIITNTSINEELDEIHSIINKIYVDHCDVVTPNCLGHPYLLTWCHKSIFKKYYSDPCISHFLYIEDDIKITKNNILYWLWSRNILIPSGLVPSFVRYEYKVQSKIKYATDFLDYVNYYYMAKVDYNKTYTFMNLTNAYQACYLMDRELMREHLFGESFDPDFGRWDIRARAAAGLTFSNIPKGFASRNVVGVILPGMQIDEDALIHHTADNYVNDINAPNGKINIKILIKNNYFELLKYIFFKYIFILKKFKKKF